VPKTYGKQVVYHFKIVQLNKNLYIQKISVLEEEERESYFSNISKYKLQSLLTKQMLQPTLFGTRKIIICSDLVRVVMMVNHFKK